ncbi:hypothetical protein ACHAXT_011209 [Thalassiosira profunda]
MVHLTNASRPPFAVGNWRLLSPPREDREKIAVGVVEPHPSLDRVAYTTRARTDRGPDLGQARIVVHDYDLSSHCNGRVVASIRLRQLVKHINEFRAHSAMAASTAHAQHPRELLQGLSSATTPQSATPYTVEQLGAVQKLAFLDRDAVRSQLPPEYVREEASRMQRLLIGFRRCAVVVSVFHLKHQMKDDPHGARGVHVDAYLGPDDLDEYEHDEKARKRQPSSFPVPISEQILAYGCYDGGIRFYDVVRRKQVKSALGPGGRGNPVVRVINANKAERTGGHRRTAECQTTLPRIISVCATGVAYLWELDLSIDLDNGEVICFSVPPPLASFDGLVAAVSWKGIPVRYPPSLSPTSLATLSPCSSWEQTDEVNSQFEVSFDQSRNVLHWVFSPDCIGATLVPHATHDERLDMNGALVSWDLSALPRQEWPPSALPPHFVAQIPRREGGRVSCDKIVPGIQGVLPDSQLATLCMTSTHMLLAAVMDLTERRDCVQLDTDAFALTNLTTLHCGHHGFVRGFECHAVSVSNASPPAMAVGTQHGVLLGSLSGVSERKQPPDQATAIHRTQPLSYAGRGASMPQQQLDANMLHALEYRNKELERQHERSKASKAMTDKELIVLQSESKGLHERLGSTEAKIKSLENYLLLKEKTVQSRESEVEALKSDLESAEEKATVWERTARAQAGALIALQKDYNSLQEQIDRMQTSDTAQKELATAQETEVSLRNYIALLEEDKAIIDKDLDEARQQVEDCEELKASLRADVREQKNAIDSLVDLLEKQKQTHTKEIAGRDEEIDSLRKQLSGLQVKYQSEVANAKRLNEEMASTLQAENAVLKADAENGSEVFVLMKNELRKALNELAQYQHEEHKCN